MSHTKELWDRVYMTDPKAVKPITGKQYQGNSPKPYWLIERMTEEFGPVGIGWGVNVKSERFERLGEFDVLHVAVVAVWYVKDGLRCEPFEQMGGTKAAYKTAKGTLMVDEDAGKKSVTDGMVKCLSMIGFAGDIFSGRWDDSKYVAEALEHYHPKPEPAKPEPKRNGVIADVLSTMPPLPDEQKEFLGELAANVIDLFGSKGQAVAFDRIQAENLDDHQKIYLSSKLDSKIRSALKIERGLRIGAA